MKTDIKKYIFVIFCSMLTSGAIAQSFRSAYFLEGVTGRHRLNPAFMGESNYISLPGLGYIGTGIQGNVGLTDFIYPYDDPSGKYELTTFMSSTVKGEEFLNKLHDMNRIRMNLDYTILGTGFYGMGGFNSIELSLRSDMNSNIPFALFDFMKTGMDQTEGTTYQIRDMRIFSEAHAELAFGHAHAINERLTIGAKLKILLAGAYADAHVNQLDVTMAGDKWQVVAQGTVEGSLGGASFETEDDGRGDHIEGVEVDNPGMNGWGLATDLGFSYQLNHDLLLSGALTDLGFISWRNVIAGKTLNEPYEFDGFEDINTDDDDPDQSDNFDEQLEQLGDDLADLAKFYDQGAIAGKRKIIAATLNLAAEYKMPFYRKLTAGFLWTTRFNALHTFTEGRLSANLTPSKWFDFSVSYGVSNLSQSLGWIVNFHPAGFNFFIGSDQTVLNVNSQGIPLNDLNAGIFMGMNINFGKRRY
jgi:hypothetical protein